MRIDVFKISVERQKLLPKLAKNVNKKVYKHQRFVPVECEVQNWIHTQINQIKVGTNLQHYRNITASKPYDADDKCPDEEEQRLEQNSELNHRQRAN